MPDRDPRTAVRPVHVRPPSRAVDDSSEPARRFAAAVVPRRADFVAVHLAEESPHASAGGLPGAVPLRRVVSLDVTASYRLGGLMPQGGVLRWTPDSPVHVALERGETVHIPRVDGAVADHLASQLGVPGLAGALTGRSLLMLPLAGAGRLFGNALLVGEPSRPAWTAAEIEMIEELAVWTARDVREARWRRHVNRLAYELWRETGPELPARTPGLEVGYRYLPYEADGAWRLGGDWFDVLNLPDGRTALFVGDVAGHGPDAAVRMGQCKAMVRTLASLGLAPGELLRRFDLLVRGLAEEYGGDDEFLVTCVYAVYDPVARKCRVASAGHVPPVLVGPDGRGRLLRPIRGLPVGAGPPGGTEAASFRTRTFGAVDGSLLALYTDGLVECRGRDVEEGIREVAAGLGGPSGDLEGTCDEVLARLGAEQRRDDVTLLLARLTGPQRRAPVRRARSVTVPPARRIRRGERAVRPEPRPEEPPEPGGEPGQGGLPVDERPVFGRDAEVREIRRRLESGRLVTLTGPAGVGKSRLAVHAAGGLRDAFPDGVRFAELSGLRDPADLPGAVAAAFGLEARAGEPAERVVLRHLEGRRVLLVLDTCEHLAAACAGLVRDVLRAAPGVRVLATGRRPLRLAGEHVLAVGPLDPEPAAAMLVARVAAVAPRAAPDAADGERVRAICRRLDHLPLGIELAAGRLRALSLDDLHARLRHPLEALTGDHEMAVWRHRSLRAAIGWSHELCDPRERLLWARLAVFPVDFDLAAAESVGAGGAIGREEVLGLLARLIRVSVVLPEKGRADPRYRMLAGTRAFGREQLARLEEEAERRRRHRDWFQRIALDGADRWAGPGQAVHCERLRTERANFREALEFCFSGANEARAGLDMAAALWPRWGLGGPVAEGRAWLERGLSLAPASGPLRSRALRVHGWLASLQGDHASALRSLEGSCTAAEDAGDDLGSARALQFSAEIAMRRGDEAVAVPLYEEALARLRRAGEDPGVRTCLYQLALCHALQPRSAPPDLRRALDLCKEGMGAGRTSGELWCLSCTWHAYGLCSWRLGRVRAAEKAVLECLRLKRPLRDRLGAGFALELLAWIAVADERHGRAARLIGAARRALDGAGASLTAYVRMVVFHDAAVARIRAALGADSADRLVKQAAARPLDHMISELLGDPPPRG
ncbi:SpoIIE family protein phosphatase [Actinomadura fibrosa]|uniref:SpoIIE family protein phosphatase n=3 Tax=Actinomadura fibrosa TaxID=111802 RepID=A0ABW2Y1W8_9ACTN